MVSLLTEYDRQLQPTNTTINSIADDVEMQAPPAETSLGTYVIVDTNILLHYFEALRSFVEDVEKAHMPVIVVVPGAVLYELDNLKSRDRDMTWPARRASGWLLDRLKEQKGAVKVQATEDTLKSTRNWRSKIDDVAIPSNMMNDHLILDCTQFFRSRQPRTILCTADQNLCIIAQSQGIPYMSPPPKHKAWNSREIALVLFGADFELVKHFRADNAAYGKDRGRERGIRRVEDEDGMMVDEEEERSVEQPLNVLHDDIRVFFTRMLKELSLRIGGEDLRNLGKEGSSLRLTTSQYASRWRTKRPDSWEIGETLEYLCDQQPGLRGEIEGSQPRLESFLAKRYTGNGSRTGREWPVASWRSALMKLELVGRRFSDGAIVEAARDLFLSLTSMNFRRPLYAALAFLAIFLLGTVIVLSSVTYYLAIDPKAFLNEHDLIVNNNASERIPRIIHQTWKTDVLPSRWQPISQACRDMMPDYEYMLWTDDSSRSFLAEHYPWFLETFDNYQYPIQRADAIRYFVLHRYGGIYMDLDIGCLRPMDPLLKFPVVLPKTIPVGVSNDLMFSEKGHPFMEQTINNLITFDHSWVINYPTVMFSTGPMFLSAQYGVYTTSHPTSAIADIRILPKSLYGKNALPEDVPNSFFSHFYGSSWHAEDAAFIGFLFTWGKALMWVGFVVLIIGVIRVVFKGQSRSLGKIGGYEISIPRLSRSGRWYLPLVVRPSSSSPFTLSPRSSHSSLDNLPGSVRLPLIRPPSPSDDLDDESGFAGRNTPITDAFRHVRNRMASMVSGTHREAHTTPTRPRRHSGSTALFFLPAIFAAPGSSSRRTSPDIEMDTPPPSYSASSHRRNQSYGDLDSKMDPFADADFDSPTTGDGQQHDDSRSSSRASSSRHHPR